MTSDLLFKLLDAYGLPIVILFAIGAFVWRVVVPAFMKKLEQMEKERLKREEEYRKNADVYRNFLLEEIKLLREDAKEDKAQMRLLLSDQTKSNIELRNTLAGITNELRTLNQRVENIDDDMGRVYLLLGERRNLIQKKDS